MLKRTSLALAALPGLASACAMVLPDGATARMGDESAYIVWDEARKTEHFVRQVAFEGDAKDVGLLVPTPSVPEIAEVDDPLLFQKLSRQMANDEGQPLAGLGFIATFSESASAVVAETTTKNYRATVLRASDPKGVRTWAKENGFRMPDARWLARYARDGWYLTAFRASRREGSAISLPPVRLSFRTDRPFYPYREPARKEGDERNLNLYVAAPWRADARIGGTLWEGQTLVAKTWRHFREKDGLPPLFGAKGIERVTLLSETTARRPGDAELDLLPADDQSWVGARSLPHHPAWLLLPVVAVGAVGYGWRRARKSRR